MESKQESSSVQVQGSTSKMSRKEQRKIMREKTKAKVAQRRLMSNNNNHGEGLTFTSLIHSVMNPVRRRPPLPVTFSPITQFIATTPNLPTYAYAVAPAGYRVNGNTSSTPLPAAVEPREVVEDNMSTDIGIGMLRMVWTTGGIPGGHRVDGIMYRRINQGSIVCCCHAEIFTPAEFVIHAGGAPVDDPALLIHLSI